ncbi:MAG: hypothetical protein RL660_1076 [Bacteroidota bacterium]
MAETCIIIGGGAAGFFCAAQLAELNPRIKITILEASDKLLSKVRISGGGRCNVTHNCDSISTMAKRYPRGEQHVKKIFKHFFVPDTLAWFTKRGVPIVAEADGRMFPKANVSEAIIDCLMQATQKPNISIKLHHKVLSIEHEQNFTLHTSSAKLQCDYLVIACGGFPKLSMFEFMQGLGHSIVTPVPSLFTFNLPKHPITQLMGLVATDARISIKGFKEMSEGPVLITHWGFSGPAVLRLSAFAARFLQECNYTYTIMLNWCASFNENTMLSHLRDFRNDNGRLSLANAKPVDLPNRLWLFFLESCGIVASIKWSELPAKQQNLLAKTLCASEFAASGKTTYKDEFVTAGGVDLSEIDSSTCMSKKVNQLYFAGEILNCDGITGGYNFQHAWSSASVAASSIAKQSSELN